jgi:hypothetical protein
MTRKVKDAAGRLKKRRERKGMWDEVNVSANKFDALKGMPDENAAEEEKDDWEDMEEVEDNSVVEKGLEVLPSMPGPTLVVADRTAPAPAESKAEATNEIDQIT